MTNLVLGGHSFIEQLGTDPAPDRVQAREIVQACLDQGVVRFDTTYAPERVALGQALSHLGRRAEALVIAWNFFERFGPGESVGGHAPFRPEHLQAMLDELQTEWIDLLVVHPVDDASEQARQQELAAGWLADGKVRALGTWMPGHSVPREPYSAAFAPYNAATPEAAAWFAGYRERGWETYATSPFVRGWELDKRVAASGRSKADEADMMLRYAAFAPDVDYLIVSMRRVEWVAANVASWGRGPVD